MIKIFRQTISIRKEKSFSGRDPNLYAPKNLFSFLSLGRSGFSLLEMIVVIAIIVMISTVVMPSVGSYFQVSLNSATRDLATTIKETYNSTVVTGRVHRIVFDFKENSYWVESGPMNTLLDTKESKEKEERRRKFSKTSDGKDQSGFTLEKSVSRKKTVLPRGVEFEDIVTLQSPSPLTGGKAYTHFFPHGVTEQTIIHLQDQSKHHASLAITPIMGLTDVYDRYVKGDDIFEK